MTEIIINAQEPYKTFMLKGIKRIEGRLNKGKFALINVGDILILEPEKNKFKIQRKRIYSSFREMIKKEGIKNIIPDKNKINDAVNVYYEFYTKEQEKKFGVVAIQIKKIAPNNVLPFRERRDKNF